MNHKFILFLWLAIIITNHSHTSAQIPVFEWASNQQYAGSMLERAITADASGNVYITGYWNGFHDFDPGPQDLLVQSIGNNDMYLIKLNPQGNLMWVHTFGTLGVERGLSVFTDSIGNVYFSGIYGNTIDFDKGPGTFNLTPTTSVSFGFLASYDTDGNFRWAQSLPGHLNSSMDSDDVSYAPDGTILITDIFNGTIDFDPGPGTFNMTTTSFENMYVLKLDLDGNLIWARHFEGGYVRATSIKGHSSGNIFATGYYYGATDFDPGPSSQTVTDVGYGDSYVLKLNSSGDLIWGKSFGGPNYDKPYEIEIDDQQNVYITGIFTGTSDFDPGPGVANITFEGDEDPFLLKLDANGNFQWVHNYGGILFDLRISISTDPMGNIYAVGRYTDTLDFEPGQGVTNYIAGITGSSLFITKLSTNGDLFWVKSFDSSGQKAGRSIYCAPSGHFYVAGEYDQIIDFNPGFGNAIYNGLGGVAGFNLKYSQCYQSNPVPNLSALPNISADCTLDTLVAPTAIAPCLGAIVGVPNVTFPITSIGTTIVTWIYDAGNGFVSTQNQTIIITDTESPVPNVSNLPDVSFICSTSTLTAPSATDNCSNTVTVTNDATFPIQANTTVTWTYDDGNGNTSTQTQNVIITAIDNGVTQIEVTTLSAVPSGYQYQWVDCDNGYAPINNATSQTFVATSNGTYAVEISDGTCTVISNCLTIAEVSLNEMSANSDILIYPNPSKERFTLSSAEELDVASIQITNELGQKVSFKVKEENGEIEISINAQSGIYYLSINGVGVYPLIRL